MSEAEPGPILLVERDPKARDLIGSWLKGAGYEVLLCPGPTAPDYSCIGGRARRCALVDPVTVIIVDLSLARDAMLQGSARMDLLGYYLSTGKRVIALGPGDQLLGRVLEEHLIPLDGVPDRQALVQTIRCNCPMRRSRESTLQPHHVCSSLGTG
jgi:CheY-like chemotaxis protein